MLLLQVLGVVRALRSRFGGFLVPGPDRKRERPKISGSINQVGDRQHRQEKKKNVWDTENVLFAFWFLATCQTD